MTWVLYPADDFQQYSEAWDELCCIGYGSYPLLDSKFVIPVLKHFGHRNVFLAVERSAQDIQSLVLLERKGYGVWETFSPSQAQLPFFVARSITPQTDSLQTLMRELPGYSWLLGMVRYDSKCFSQPKFEDQVIEKIHHATTMAVSLKGQFEEYWGSRKKKLCSNIGRSFNKVKSSGMVFRLDVLSEAKDMALAVDTYGRLESAGWKGRSGSAVHKDNVQGRFYTDVLTSFAALNGALVFNLYFDDQLVASRFAVVQNDVVIMLKTTYDEEYAPYAPGRLLLYLVLEYLFENYLGGMVEFYTKASPDQLHWATDKREIFHLNIYRFAGLQRLFSRLHTRQQLKSLGA